MNAYIHIPDNELKEVVDYMWFHQEDNLDAFVITLPFMHQELIINFGEKFSMQAGNKSFNYTKAGCISGLWQKQMTTRVKGRYNAIGIMFKPQGLHRLFGLDASTLTQPQTLYGIWGKNTQSIVAQIEQKPTPDQKIKTLEKLLLANAVPKQTHPLVIEFAQTVQYEPLQKGRQKNYLSNRHFSQKKFIRQFDATFGLTPSKYWQLKQINQAIAQIARHPQTSLVQVAFDCGFYDQAHFIRIFKRYTGITPLTYKKMVKAGNVHSSFPNSINPQKGNFVQFFD